jgi:hypothetical protein
MRYMAALTLARWVSATQRRKVNLLLIPNTHHVIAQQFLLVRLLIEECARNIARVDDA